VSRHWTEIIFQRPFNTVHSTERVGWG